MVLVIVVITMVVLVIMVGELVSVVVVVAGGGIGESCVLFVGALYISQRKMPVFGLVLLSCFFLLVVIVVGWIVWCLLYFLVIGLMTAVLLLAFIV